MTDTGTLEAAQRLLGTLVAGRSALLQLATAHLSVSRAAPFYTEHSSDGGLLEMVHDVLDRRMVVAARRVVVVESRTASAEPRPARETEGRVFASTRLQRALSRNEPKVETGAAPVSEELEPSPEESAPRKVTPWIEAPAPGVEDVAPAAVAAAAVAAVVAGSAGTPKEEAPPAAPEAVAAPVQDLDSSPAPVVEPLIEEASPLSNTEPTLASEVRVDEERPLASESTSALRALIGDTGEVMPRSLVEPAAAVTGFEETAFTSVEDPVEDVPELTPALAEVTPVMTPALSAADMDAVIHEPATDADVVAAVPPSEAFDDPPARRPPSDLRKALQEATRSARGESNARMPDERTDPSMASPVARGTPRLRAQEAAEEEPSLAQVRAVSPAAVRVAGAEDDLAADALGAEDDDGQLGVGEAVGAGLRVGKKKDEPAESHAPRLTEDAPAEAPEPPVVAHTPDTAADDGRVDAMLKDANTQADRGEFAKAIQTYSDALDIRFNRVDAYIGRGRCQLELGDYSSAMSDFQRAEDLSPDRPEAHVAMGDLYFARKEYRRAIECYDQAVELDGSHAMARCRRGISHYYRKNYRQAYQDLQRALTLDPEIPNIRKYVQMASKKMERPD